MLSTTTFSNELRSDIRSMIRHASGFEAFRIQNGNFASRQMTLELMLRAIAELGLEAEAEALIARHASRATVPGPIIHHDVESGGDFAEAMRIQRERETRAAQMTVTTVTPEASADFIPLDGEAVLGQLRPFVSDKLLSTVENALRPIVEAANKPAVEVVKTVEVERVVETVHAAGVTRVVSRAKRSGASTFGKLFNAPRHAQSAFPVALWDSAEAEAADPMYVVDANNMAALVTAAERGGWTWLAGPAGGGKSSMPQYYAARTGRPFVTIAFNRATETVDLVGQYVLDGKGGMVWNDGVLTQAIRRPGTVILLDEIMFAPAGMLAILQTLLSARATTIHASGERVAVAEGVVFVCADNTRGYGDETGLYAGTVQANAALVDRMARMIVVDYLDAKLESQALANHTGAPKAACERVVAFIGGARKLSGFENRPMSLRRMVAFVNAVQDGFTVPAAFEMTMLSRLPEAEREALRQHVRGNFDAGAFSAEMSNRPVPAAPSNAPNQAAARGVFDSVE